MHSRAVPGLLREIKIFSAPAEAGRRLRIVYLSCFAAWSFAAWSFSWSALFLLALFFFELFFFEPRNILSAGQLHEQTRMREEEARQTKF